MHWLHVAGLLVTKIGMEHFPEYAELALGELAALLSLENTPMNALNLVQIAAALIFSVHNAALKGELLAECAMASPSTFRCRPRDLLGSAIHCSADGSLTVDRANVGSKGSP